jgi:hypothetical protein
MTGKNQAILKINSISKLDNPYKQNNPKDIQIARMSCLKTTCEILIDFLA